MTDGKVFCSSSSATAGEKSQDFGVVAERRPGKAGDGAGADGSA